MAVDVARTGDRHQSWPAKVVAFFQSIPAFFQSIPSYYRLVLNEMRRVTWPSVDEIRQLSVMVVVLSLFIGGVIAVMDVTFQAVLVKWIPQLFAR